MLERAVRAGDEAAFTALVERYRRPAAGALLSDARLVRRRRGPGPGDAAARVAGRAGFEGRSLVRTWLYRIATNACLNALARGPQAGAAAGRRPGRDRRHRPVRRRAPSRRGLPSSPGSSRSPIAWLEPAAPGDAEPEAGRSPARRSSWRSWRRCSICRPAAGGAHPARRARLVGQGDRRPAGHQRGVGEQRAPARPGDDARRACRRRAAGRAGDRPRAGHAAGLHGRLGAGGRRRADRAAARGRALGDAPGPALVRRARGDRPPVRALPDRLAGSRRAHAAGGGEPAAGGAPVHPAGPARPLSIWPPSTCCGSKTGRSPRSPRSVPGSAPPSACRPPSDGRATARSGFVSLPTDEFSRGRV